MRLIYSSPKNRCLSNSYSAGFTLVEMLVAIAILATVMVAAMLAIPNHDDRYWRENLSQLVRSLNLAQEEASFTGMDMLVQIDNQGWRFIANSARLSAPSSQANFSVRLENAPSTNFGLSVGMNPVRDEFYRSQVWYKPVAMESVQLNLNPEPITTPWQTTIVQENRKVILQRSNTGHFSWNESGAP